MISPLLPLFLFLSWPSGSAVRGNHHLSLVSQVVSRSEFGDFWNLFWLFWTGFWDSLSVQFCAQSPLQLFLPAASDCTRPRYKHSPMVSEEVVPHFFTLSSPPPCFCLLCPFSSGHLELNWQSEPRPFCFSDIDDSWLASGSVEGFINQSFARSHARCSIGINMWTG